MKRYPPSWWLLISAVIILLAVPSGAQPVPSEAPVNVHYVDSLGSNFLFRGGTPCTGTDPASVKFNYDGSLQRASLVGLRLNLEFGRTLHWDSSIPCASWTAYLPLVGCGF
jgi:hypothetical protein